MLTQDNVSESQNRHRHERYMWRGIVVYGVGEKQGYHARERLKYPLHPSYKLHITKHRMGKQSPGLQTPESGVR